MTFNLPMVDQKIDLNTRPSDWLANKVSFSALTFFDFSNEC